MEALEDDYYHYYHTKCPLRLCLAFTTFGHWNLAVYVLLRGRPVDARLDARKAEPPLQP
jgi:hypothetical protein